MAGSSATDDKRPTGELELDMNQGLLTHSRARDELKRTPSICERCRAFLAGRSATIVDIFSYLMLAFQLAFQFGHSIAHALLRFFRDMLTRGAWATSTKVSNAQARRTKRKIPMRTFSSGGLTSHVDST